MPPEPLVVVLLLLLLGLPEVLLLLAVLLALAPPCALLPPLAELPPCAELPPAALPLLTELLLVVPCPELPPAPDPLPEGSPDDPVELVEVPDPLEDPVAAFPDPLLPQPALENASATAVPTVNGQTRCEGEDDMPRGYRLSCAPSASLARDRANDVALAWGWIDGQKRRDAISWLQKAFPTTIPKSAMTTKHDAAKAIANMHVTMKQAAKNASSGAGRAFEAQQRRKQEQIKAARRAEEARRAPKVPVPSAPAASEPAGTDSDPTERTP